MALAIGIGATACLPDTGPPPTQDPYQRAMYDAVNRDRETPACRRLTFSPKLSGLAGASFVRHDDAGLTVPHRPRLDLEQP